MAQEIKVRGKSRTSGGAARTSVGVPLELKAEMERLLKREGRTALAEACFGFLPDRAALDVAGWADDDIFAH